MVSRKITVMVDDLDGTVSDDVCTVFFGLDGETYTIDLTSINAVRLKDFLAPFVAAGRKRLTKRQSREHWEAVREWAYANGLIPWRHRRGGLPAAVVAAYRAGTQSRG